MTICSKESVCISHNHSIVRNHKREYPLPLSVFLRHRLALTCS